MSFNRNKTVRNYIQTLTSEVGLVFTTEQLIRFIVGRFVSNSEVMDGLLNINFGRWVSLNRNELRVNYVRSISIADDNGNKTTTAIWMLEEG